MKTLLYVALGAEIVFGSQYLRGLIIDHEGRLPHLEHGGGEPVAALPT